MHNHAEAILAHVDSEPRRQTADETGVSLDLFPIEDARSLDELLAEPDSTASRGC